MSSADPQLSLLRAALAAEGSTAAWLAWRQANAIEALEGETAEIAPLIDQNLGADPNGAGGDLSERDRLRLRGVFKFHWTKHHTVQQRLADVADRFAKAGIPFALHRESAMAFAGPYAPGTRPIRRLDLLIRAEDLAAACHSLLAADWETLRPLPDAKLLPFLPGMPFRHAGGQLLFLLWQPAGAATAGDRGAGVWQRLRRREIGDAAVLAPDSTDLLLLACRYAASRGPRGPEPLAISDLYRLTGADSGTVDWQELWKRSMEAACGAEVTFALGEFKDALQSCGLDAAIPAALLRQRPPAAAMRELPPATFLGHWAHYRAVCRAERLPGGIFGFLAYLVAAHRWYWEVAHLRQMPAACLRHAVAHRATTKAARRR